MSVRVMSWVWEHSRSRKTERLVLLAIADCASEDGANAYPSMSELVRKTGLSERGVQAALTRLVALGELFVGRNLGPRGCNRYRVVMVTPADPAPPQPVHPPQNMHPADPAPPRTPCTPQDLHPPAVPAPVPPQELRDPPAVPAPGTVLEPSLEPSVNPSRPKRQRTSLAVPEHPDVEELCRHLADRIEANGSKRPTVTKAWRDAARRLLDRDKRTVDQVLRAIDWCQDDEFWRSNVLSMPKLREQYDRLRLAAQRASPARARSTTDDRVAAALALAEKLDRKEDR